MARRPFTDKPADPLEEYLCNLTRRRFFGSMASTMGAGLGMNALTGLMADVAEGRPPAAVSLVLPFSAVKHLRGAFK